ALVPFEDAGQERPRHLERAHVGGVDFGELAESMIRMVLGSHAPLAVILERRQAYRGQPVRVGSDGSRCCLRFRTAPGQQVDSERHDGAAPRALPISYVIARHEPLTTRCFTTSAS